MRLTVSLEEDDELIEDLNQLLGPRPRNRLCITGGARWHNGAVGPPKQTREEGQWVHSAPTTLGATRAYTGPQGPSTEHTASAPNAPPLML